MGLKGTFGESRYRKKTIYPHPSLGVTNTSRLGRHPFGGQDMDSGVLLGLDKQLDLSCKKRFEMLLLERETL